MKFKKEKCDFFKKESKEFKTDTKSLMKTALAFPLVAGGILIGTKLVGEISK
jgi:hypothetical protein